MSQPQSRAERRHGSHGGGKPPVKRDPMINVYIGIAVAVVLIFGIFGYMKWREDQTLATAIATPTPGPNATSKPIQLADGGAIGKPAFPMGNSSDGGNGSPVDGILCEPTERVTLHIHAHLALFDHGVQIQIPAGIGAAAATQCLYWTHTHDASGIIHVEAPDYTSPAGGPFTLGMLFDVWGEPLTRTQVARYKGPVTAYVNGALYDGDLRAIPLAAHQQITLEVGKPLVPPPNYVFPPND